MILLGVYVGFQYNFIYPIWINTKPIAINLPNGHQTIASQTRTMKCIVPKVVFM